MSAALSRLQSQDSRDEILKAATQLFAGRGFHETSMAEVAREAKVSKALIFWHFKTKEELFVAVLNRLMEPYHIDFAEETRELVRMALVFQSGARRTSRIIRSESPSFARSSSLVILGTSAALTVLISRPLPITLRVTARTMNILLPIALPPLTYGDQRLCRNPGRPLVLHGSAVGPSHGFS